MKSLLILKIALGSLLFPLTFLAAQNVSINTSGTLPDSNAILDISSTTSGLLINDIDLSNNYFFYPGQTGIKVNTGSSINNGRMTTNLFRGVTTLLNGFDSYSFGWQMQQNTGIPNTRSFGYNYADGNTTPTTFSVVGTYTKILGTTTLITGQKISASNNRFTYTGKEYITSRGFASIGVNASGNSTDYTIAIAKNGKVIPAPTSSLGPLSNNQGFQIVLETEVDLSTGDYIEDFIWSNSVTTALAIQGG